LKFIFKFTRIIEKIIIAELNVARLATKKSKMPNQNFTLYPQLRQVANELTECGNVSKKLKVDRLAVLLV
jgi:hypothetical protein